MTDIDEIEAQLILARASAKRFIDWHFRNDNERPRVSIPAKEDSDDDLVLVGFLKKCPSLIATIRTLTEERDKLREAVESMLDATGPHGDFCKIGAIYNCTCDLAPARNAARATLTQVTVTEPDTFLANRSVTIDPD